jgi:CDP-glucose 4,6-dehydratase
MVTGHTGFKGSWLAFLLREIGAEVLGYALPPTEPDSHFSLLKLDQSIRHVEGDIRDFDRLNGTMSEFQPEFVFHMAAQAIVRESYLNPKTTFDTNVGGSVNVLEAVRYCESVRSLVYVTSDKCYENVEWVWGYRENDRLGGHDPYSASKSAAEIVFTAYSRSFFKHRSKLGAATARAGNVIGGGDWAADRIVPDCIRSISSGQPIRLRNPDATRPWQHVLEPLSGYLLLAVKLRESPSSFAGSWNFGPSSSETRTVIEMAQRIIERFGKGTIEIVPRDKNKLEAQMLQLNCDKAQQLLRWQPRWNFQKTVTVTADWYKEILDGIDATAVTLRQLNDYFGELT